MPPLHPWVCLLAALACAHTLEGCKPAASAPVQGSLEYTANAERDYQRALDKYYAHDWEEAISRFTEVKRTWGYSRFARLAELRIADAEFHQKKYPEAVAAYRAFVHDYPNDPEVPYARFQVVKALHDDTQPSFMLAPLEERDLAYVLDAHQSLRAFIDEFPTHARRDEAEFMLRTITGLLARHDLYVARYYLAERRYEAVLARIHHALEAYPASDLTPEALVLEGETRLRMKQPDAARELFETVIQEHPTSAFVVPARNFLEQLGTAIPRP